jgi:hypothetical protein
MGFSLELLEVSMISTRRRFLAAGIIAPLALSFGAIAQADTTSCGGDLPLTQKNRRRALGYVEASGDEKRRCRLCAFFSGGDGSCGACQMLSGSLVNANAVCNSFAAKGA